jgi:hypothetical protein
VRRPKKIDPARLGGLDQAGPWVRLQGLANALPYLIHVPDEKLHQVTVSGSLDHPRHERKKGVTGDTIGAVDVFRLDLKDFPTVVNKEHYFVLRDSAGDCWLHGPYGPGEDDHWLEEVPEDFADCQVLTGTLG